MHTDTVSTSTSTSTSTTVSTIADLVRELDEHHMALPEGDPGEGPSERACEVVGLLARYVGHLPSSLVADASGHLDGTRPIGRALAPSPILGRYLDVARDAGRAVNALYTTLRVALSQAEAADFDDECDAHHDAATLRGWLAEVELALPARTLVAECRTRQDAERALSAAVTPFGSLDATIPALILRAADRSAPGALDALATALAEADGEPSELVIIPHPRSGGGAWGTGVVTPTRGALILVSRTHTGDYRVWVDFPVAHGEIAQRRPMVIRNADLGVSWTTIGAAS